MKALLPKLKQHKLVLSKSKDRATRNTDTVRIENKKNKKKSGRKGQKEGEAAERRFGGATPDK
jgi:hypothetical protein